MANDKVSWPVALIVLAAGAGVLYLALKPKRAEAAAITEAVAAERAVASVQSSLPARNVTVTGTKRFTGVPPLLPAAVYHDHFGPNDRTLWYIETRITDPGGFAAPVLWTTVVDMDRLVYQPFPVGLKALFG